MKVDCGLNCFVFIYLERKDHFGGREDVGSGESA
jgi:hypothetical protein